ncbi:DUF4365 domain-containing protein [Saccharothrix lopnurensis]|uniref:DUF4365 domain-containing protein n=1 Tax=Saccharothrix lopnurensis TaxID=1670621 RepID=A0ABW1P544_9PSEU
MGDVNGSSVEVESAAVVPDGGLPDEARQEQFSLGFVRMVAAAAGFSIKSHETDYDGVDVTIAASAEYGTFYCAALEMQLKCTTRHSLLKDDHLSWQLERARFLKLTNPKRYLPAFIGVLLIPPDLTDLLEMTEERMVSSCRMYWEYAGNLGSIADDRDSKTLKLPRSNLFDVDGLKGIMQMIGEGGLE